MTPSKSNKSFAAAIFTIKKTPKLYIILHIKILRNREDTRRYLLNKIFIYKNYDTGRADDIELLYTYQANDVVGAEGCLKAYLKKYQYRKYKEVYQADLSMIKEFTKSCSNIGAKLIQNQSKTKMKGGYYIVLTP